MCNALRRSRSTKEPTFALGYRAEGGTADLSELGRAFGFDVAIHGACQVRGSTVSSSKIRELLSRGERASRVHCWGMVFSSIRNRPVGVALVEGLTVPTINLAPYHELLPPNGVYVTQLRVAGEWFDVETNVGKWLTFCTDSFAVELHWLNLHPLEFQNRRR